MKWVILVLLATSCVLAVEVDFDCPDKIYVDEEFECEVGVSNGSGVYDLKVDLDGERDSVLEIWDGKSWNSGYYYYQNFIEDGDSEDVRLRVSDEGSWDGVLKLRQGDGVLKFDFEMRVREEREEATDKEEEDVKDSERDIENETEEDIVWASEEPDIIFLNSENVAENKDVVYVSKNARVVDWLPYGFCLFLILVVGILLWERGTEK